MSNPYVTTQSQGRQYDCTPNWQMTFLLPPQAITDYDFAEIETGYLGGPPLHKHPQQDETHYLLQVQLRYQIGEQTIDLYSGDCIHIPSGTSYAWINLHPEPARTLAILNPGNSEGFFQTPNPDSLEPEALLKLAQDYGTEIIGLPLASHLSIT